MFKTIDYILSAIENQPQWQEQQQLQQLLKCWTQVVGAKATQQTRPYAISGNILYVATSSSVWVQELKFKRHQILKQLNAQLSSRLTDIRFSTAQWHRGSASSSSSWQEHPSYVGEREEGEELGIEEVQERHTTISSSKNTQDAHSAFRQWAESIKARSQPLPLCPQCHCPTPPGELQRWHVCALCAAKQWQG
ncbi:MAG TPA: DUF721 domain-containing protein [Cyanobacteria bacterium UBA8803]|nr:DUF721 domain-containing protein [Cyanobacteria bacterium UBA9273]HBL60595.1 DUF721 domain-containing protein [Cyanobacteria bacterium UBA8803]